MHWILPGKKLRFLNWRWRIKSRWRKRSGIRWWISLDTEERPPDGGCDGQVRRGDKVWNWKICWKVLVAVSACQCTMIPRITAKKLLTIIMIFLKGQDHKLDCRSSFLMTILIITDWHASPWRTGGQMLKTAKLRAGELRSKGMVTRWSGSTWWKRRKTRNENIESDSLG